MTIRVHEKVLSTDAAAAGARAQGVQAIAIHVPALLLWLSRTVGA